MKKELFEEVEYNHDHEPTLAELSVWVTQDDPWLAQYDTRVTKN